MDKNKLELLVRLYNMDNLSKKEIEEVNTLLKELIIKVNTAKLNSF